MKLSWLASLGLLALGMGLIDFLRRKHERANRPSYREDIDAWYSDMPHITPLALPEVKKLVGRKVGYSDRVSRFKQRIGRGSDR